MPGVPGRKDDLPFCCGRVERADRAGVRPVDVDADVGGADRGELDVGAEVASQTTGDEGRAIICEASIRPLARPAGDEERDAWECSVRFDEEIDPVRSIEWAYGGQHAGRVSGRPRSRRAARDSSVFASGDALSPEPKLEITRAIDDTKGARRER